jgi:hypothetical protein
MKTNYVMLTIAFVCIVSNQLVAQVYDFDSLYQNDATFKNTIEAEDLFQDLFASDNVIRLIITSDFKNLMKRKYKDEYQDAVLTYYFNDTIAATRSIEIKPRGNMRRHTCYFPPLKLNFPKKDALLEQIHDFDKMKMVMDCKRGETYEQYLLSEYYAYKIYNLITDYSFRVRLFELTLVDSSDKIKSLKSYAFIIEDIDMLAKRMNAITFEHQNIRDDHTNLETLANGYLFQYLIGNTDWSIPAMHNVTMIKSSDPSVVSPHFIPYDFDYAGIVNTNYAVPDEKLGIESVRERVYRGICIEDSYIVNAVEQFRQQKESIYHIYQSSGLLDKNNLRNTLHYLDEFYDILENDFKLKRNVLEQCR